MRCGDVFRAQEWGESVYLIFLREYPSGFSFCAEIDAESGEMSECTVNLRQRQKDRFIKCGHINLPEIIREAIAKIAEREATNDEKAQNHGQ